MSSNASQPDRQRGFRSPLGAAWAGLGLGLLMAGSVAAQASMPSSQSGSSAAGMATTMQSSTASAAATERAYEEMDWTGRPAAPAIRRKEAGAALVQGRRHCATMRAASDRQNCLRVVQEDYQEMLAGMQSRTARR
jgi:hypothetical protein